MQKWFWFHFLHSVLITLTALSTCKAIKERCQRMADREEPSDGISLKFKYPNGSMSIGRFAESESIQVMLLLGCKLIRGGNGDKDANSIVGSRGMHP